MLLCACSASVIQLHLSDGCNALAQPNVFLYSEESSGMLPGALNFAFVTTTICFFAYKETFDMSSGIAKYLGGTESSLPHNVRVTPDGKMVSVIDIIMVVSFTDNDRHLKKSARKNASDYNQMLIRNHPDIAALQRSFRFKGQGQRDTPVAARNGMFQIIQLLRGKQASKFRESMAGLLERYLEADMGLADDITDRALEAHLTELKRGRQTKQPEEEAEKDKRIKSRDSTKMLGDALKQAGARLHHYGKTHGGINQAIVGMPTAAYRRIQVNLDNGTPRNAFTESMLGMSATVMCLVRDNLDAGKTPDDQLLFVDDNCKKAAQLLGLHEQALVIQPRSYIEGNKEVMARQLAADKRERLCATPAHGEQQETLMPAKKQRLITAH